MSFFTVAEFRKDPDQAILAARVQPEPQSITWGSQIRVDEGQEAIFLKEGQLVSVIEPSRITAWNGTLWSHLFRQIFGGSNAWRAEVWLIDKTLIPGWRWEMPRPMNLARDRETKIPLELNLEGSFGIRVIDSAAFVRKLVGNSDIYRAANVAPTIAERTAHYAAHVCAQALAQNDRSWLAGNLAQTADAISTFTNAALSEYGLAIGQLTIYPSLSERTLVALSDLAMYEKMSELMEDRQRRLGSDGFAIAQLTEALGQLAAKGGGGGIDVATLMLLGNITNGLGGRSPRLPN